MNKGIGRQRTLSQYRPETRLSHTFAVDQLASVDVLVWPLTNRWTHTVLDVEGELGVAIAFQPLKQREMVAHSVNGGIANSGCKLVTVSDEEKEGWLYAERDEALGLSALGGFVDDDDGDLRALAEEVVDLAVG